MKIIEGDIWSQDRDAVVMIPTNCIVVKGCLVMGAGMALQAKQRYPKLPELFGARLQREPPSMFYGVVSVFFREKPKVDRFVRVGAFQTKYHWRDPSPLELIERSTAKLLQHAHKFEHIVLPYLPGCGEGGLNESVVLRILETLPDNVSVCRRPPA